MLFKKSKTISSLYNCGIDSNSTTVKTCIFSGMLVMASDMYILIHILPLMFWLIFVDLFSPIMQPSLKKILKAYLEIQTCIMLDKIGPKLPVWPKRGFFGKFYSSDFHLLIVSYYAAKFLTYKLGKKYLDWILKNSIIYRHTNTQTQTHHNHIYIDKLMTVSLST